MAAPVLCGRTAALCRTLKGVSASTTASSRWGVMIQAASYNPKPLKLNLRAPYIPDKDSPKTPEWQKTARYDGKLYGRYGSASGIDPASLWPSHEQLDRLVAEEYEWQPTLETMLKNIETKEKEERQKRLARERLIAANMAAMPKMIADWRREKREAKQRKKDEKARREMLLIQAKERFGYTVDPRSGKFQEMLAEIEKEEKKKKKLLKSRQKEEQAAPPVPPPPPATASG